MIYVIGGKGENKYVYKRFVHFVLEYAFDIVASSKAATVSHIFTHICLIL